MDVDVCVCGCGGVDVGVWEWVGFLSVDARGRDGERGVREVVC